MTWMTDDDVASAPALALTVCGGMHVLAQRQEVMFKDGTSVQLHPVQVGGTRDTFMRALQISGAWMVTDLRHHGPELEDDVLRLQPRDTQGVVFFTLRGAYRCRDEFVRAVLHMADSRSARHAPPPFPPPRHQAQPTAKDLFS
jgi:hypothetical protein